MQNRVTLQNIMLLFTYFLVMPCDSSSVTILRNISFMCLQILLVRTESTSCIPTRKHQWGQIWPTECSALECFKSSPSISISMHWNTPWLVDRNKVDRCRVSATYIYNIAWERMSFKRPGISFYEKCKNTVKSPLGTKSPAHLSSIRGHYKFTENQWSKFHVMECWRLLEENPQA